MSEKENEKGKSTEEKATNGKKKKLKKVIIIAILLAAAAVGTAVFFFFNTPERRVKRALSLAEKYIEEMDYERAVAQLQLALEIDPENKEITETVNRHLTKMLDRAEEEHIAKQYETELQITEAVLSLDITDISMMDTVLKAKKKHKRASVYIDRRKLLEEAEEDIVDGKYGDARDIFELIIIDDVVSDDFFPEINLIDAIEQIIGYVEKGDDRSLVTILDSQLFEAIIKELEHTNPFFIVSSPSILIGKKDDCIYLVYGDLNSETADGTATGVFSAANTYMIYKGSWKDYIPEGNGLLKVWRKNETIQSAISMNGVFKKGILDGEVQYSDPSVGEFPITSDKGSIRVLKDDENGNSWISQINELIGYAVINAQEKDGTISNYVTGATGFGGSDDILEIEKVYLDKPPVLTLDIPLERWTHAPRNFVGYKVTASDEEDGNLTHQITHEETRTNYEYWSDVLDVKYSVKDSAENVTTMEVVYSTSDDCDGFMIYVVSVKMSGE